MVLGATLFRLRQLETERTAATTDALTGVANRRYIMELFARRLAESGEKTSVLFLDLDGFKLINDAYGHQTGDALLKGVAERICDLCEPDHRVGRIGGDEFLVLCKEGFDRPAALTLAQRIIDVGTAPLNVGPLVLQPRLSIGVAVSLSLIHISEPTRPY